MALSQDLRLRIVDLVACGVSRREAARQFKVSASSAVGFVKQADEVASGSQGQYFGDFYGLMLAMEEYDVRFLKSHDLAKGNIYKLLSGVTNGLDVRKYLAQDAVDDGSDFSNILYNLRPERSDVWLDQHVNYDEWYRYHAVVDAVRHYDVQPNLS